MSRRIVGRAALVTAVATAVMPLLAGRAGAVVQPMCFPVVEPVKYTDTFGAARDGGARAHEGNDLLGARGFHLLAAVDGTVVDVRGPSEGDDHAVRIRGDDGWYYSYLHMNDDTPGTDDGAATWNQIFAPGITEGARVRAGDWIGYMGDSGNAESTSPHLHFELRRPAASVWASEAVSPYESLQAASRCPMGGTPTVIGWHLRDTLGGGPAELALDFGLTSYDALAGDFDGDGHDSVAIWETATGIFHLRNDLTAGPPQVSVAYGARPYQPVVGDWDGDGDDTIGVFDPTSRTFHLRDSNTPGPPTRSVEFGNSLWRPVVGDWDGDGDATVGAYDPATATFHLRNSNTSGGDQAVVTLTGTAGGAVPMAGDWDGDGDDTVGIFTEGRFRLLVANATGAGELQFDHGTRGYRPVVGDWDGGGSDGIGVVGPPAGGGGGRTVPTNWYVRNENTPGPPNASSTVATSAHQPVAGAWSGGAAAPGAWSARTGELVLTTGIPGTAVSSQLPRGGVAVAGRFTGAADEIGVYADGRFGLPGSGDAIAYGIDGYVPLVGDWDGNGTDTIGVWVPANGTFYLRNTNSPGPADVVAAYGTAGYTPVIGDWDGNGTDTIGVFVEGGWYLRNSNTPGPPDIAFSFGATGYVPVVGDWDGNGTDTIGVAVS